MLDILNKIVQTKIEEIRVCAEQVSLSELKSQCEDLPDTRGFVSAIDRQILQGKAAVISEIKKASPSQGILREIFNPVEIAQSYYAHGATCISILTDQQYFQGHNEFVEQVRRACPLAVIRKDFVIDPYQVYESRMIGADAILLIVAALDDDVLEALAELAQTLGLDVLVEVHDQMELERALALPCRLLGINNRNLHTFKTSLDTTLELLPNIPKDKIIITESGIHTSEDVALMRRHKVNGFLVGEAFMRASVPGEKLSELFIGAL